MGNPETTPDEHFSYRHYRTWPESERWELIDGHAWAMRAAPMTRHQEVLSRLHLAIGGFLKVREIEVCDSANPTIKMKIAILASDQYD